MDAALSSSRSTTKILISGILLTLMFSGVCVSINRCGFIPGPNKTIEIWKYPGEDVQLHCPAEIDYTRLTTSLDYEWFKEHYDCHGMNTTKVASLNHQLEKKVPRIRIPDQYKEKLTIEQVRGNLTIWNLTKEDDHVYTCIFTRMKEHIATVQLTIKELEEPKIKGLSDVLRENQQVNVECTVPKMVPPTGSLRLTKNGRIVKSINITGDTSPSMIHSLTAGATADWYNLTCEAEQEVNRVVRRLNTTARVAVQYSYHTKVTSRSPNQPIESTDVMLECDVTREGNPHNITGYKWSKDGRVVDSAQNISLTNTSTLDSGLYKCLIQNEDNLWTPETNAQEFKLEVIPKHCLPDIQVQDIEVKNESLTVSWNNLYECTDRSPDAEVSIRIQMETENRTIEYPADGSRAVMASQKKQRIPGKFVASKNHFVCLTLKRFQPEILLAQCKLSKGVSTGAATMHDRFRQAATIAGYLILGASVVVAIGCIISAMQTESKRRAAQKRQYGYEASSTQAGVYEDLDNLNPLKTSRKDSFSNMAYRNRLASFTGSIRYCPEGAGLPAVYLDNTSGKSWSRSSSASETPPPLPDFGELIGSRPMEPSPLADSHYNNRTTIAAFNPRKSVACYVKTEMPLESLLESCQDTYSVCGKNVLPQCAQRESRPDDYMDMHGVAAAKNQRLLPKEVKE